MLSGSRRCIRRHVVYFLAEYLFLTPIILIDECVFLAEYSFSFSSSLKIVQPWTISVAENSLFIYFWLLSSILCFSWLNILIEPENSTTISMAENSLFIYFWLLLRKSVDSEDSDIYKVVGAGSWWCYRSARTSHGMCQNCASRSDIIESVSLLPHYFPTVAVMMENIYGEPK